MTFHFLDLFRPKPSHKEVRYAAATKAENVAAQRLSLHRRLELAVACAQLTLNSVPSSRTVLLGGRG